MVDYAFFIMEELITMEINLIQNDLSQAGELTRVFRNVTNSYKYIFFKSILDALNLTGVLSEVKNPIPLKELYYLFIVNSWYPVVTFKLSFGKQDQIPKMIYALRELNLPEFLEFDLDYYQFMSVLHKIQEREEIQKIFSILDRYVKYRFLTAWMDDRLRGLKDHHKNGKIEEITNEDFTKPKNEQVLPYHFIKFNNEDCIQFSSKFVNYLKNNSLIVYDWWRWNFAKYLQINNPLIPGIINKIEKPYRRDLVVAKYYWNTVLTMDSSIKCLYSQTDLDKYDIDHFIPWSFVTHDKLWNLIPVNSSINRQKSDNLPQLSFYLDNFVDVQLHSMELFSSKYLKHDYWKEKKIKATIEEYQFSQNENVLLEFQENAPKVKDKLKDQIKILYEVALSQGFKEWKY